MNNIGQHSNDNYCKNSFLASKRSIYHQAGYAAAIHLLNRKKRLPPIHFQIIFRAKAKPKKTGKDLQTLAAKSQAQLEDGRLVPHLPPSFKFATRLLPPASQLKCQMALEADVINFLAGYIAEAKYVALRDDEVFNANLVYLGSLKFYGGSEDLKVIDEYMCCLIPEDKKARSKRLAELYLDAYSFVNDAGNWSAISRLAEAMGDAPKPVFALEELVAYLDDASEPAIAPHGGFILQEKPENWAAARSATKNAVTMLNNINQST